MSGVRGTEGSHSLVVDGDPDSCHGVARALAGLAEVLREAADVLLRQADGADGVDGVDADRPRGLWVAAYQARCRHLATEADDLGVRTDTLAAALALLAEALERAGALMLEVERLAAPHALVVDRHLVAPRTPDRAAGAWVAWRDAVSLVRLARRIERDARHAWERALEEPWDRPAPAGSGGPDPSRPPLPPTSCPAPEPPRLPPHPPRQSGRSRAPDLVPITCGLTPRDPDGFCATPEPFAPSRPEGARRAGR